MADPQFWEGKSVFVTGHTGFKGSWLSLWLEQLGAKVTGYALDPPSDMNLYEQAGIGSRLDRDIRGDICDILTLEAAIEESRPEVVFHLAAQPLVRQSYVEPVETYMTNVIGTVKLLEVCRHRPSIKAIIVITTDKCYENREWLWGYRESDPMGGFDPYSSSKGAAELVVSAYRRSFFQNCAADAGSSTGVATVRAGNVIGGGDWADDRIVPDIVRSLRAGKDLILRNPNATRPWQHVLEPLSGYLSLGEKLYFAPDAYGEAWNFGPDRDGDRTVGQLADAFLKIWGDQDRKIIVESNATEHEANLLSLDISKARKRLNWKPMWSFEKSVEMTVQWYRDYEIGSPLKLMVSQLGKFQEERQNN